MEQFACVAEACWVRQVSRRCLGLLNGACWQTLGLLSDLPVTHFLSQFAVVCFLCSLTFLTRSPSLFFVTTDFFGIRKQKKFLNPQCHTLKTPEHKTIDQIALWQDRIEICYPDYMQVLFPITSYYSYKQPSRALKSGGASRETQTIVITQF